MPPRIDLELPAARVTTSAAVPSAATKLRIVYDPNASVVHACPTGPDTGSDCGDSVPYGFVLDGSPGALALPSRFTGLMESSGDVVLDDLPVSLTLDAATANVPVTLTTDSWLPGAVVEGTPLQGLGTWMLVGVIAGDSCRRPSRSRRSCSAWRASRGRCRTRTVAGALAEACVELAPEPSTQQVTVTDASAGSMHSTL